MIDIARLPVVDVHCHPYLNRGTLTPEEFTNLASFGGGSQRFMEDGGVTFTEDVRAELQRVKRDTVYFRRMIHDLSRFFAVEPDLETVLARRNREIEADYRDYVTRLFADAGVATLLFDFGYPDAAT